MVENNIKNMISNLINEIKTTTENNLNQSSRKKDINDEYHRMVGSFCLMMDSLPPWSIFVAISNQVESIDEAILRRFNIKIKMDDVDMQIFESELFSLAKQNQIEFKKEICHKILAAKEKYLDYSTIETIITEAIIYDYLLEESIMKILNMSSIKLLKKHKKGNNYGRRT